jgi:hypothetical protein
MLHADDQASGDSLMLESYALLESCFSRIEDTGRYWRICRVTGHCRAKVTRNELAGDAGRY